MRNVIDSSPYEGLSPGMKIVVNGDAASADGRSSEGILASWQKYDRDGNLVILNKNPFD
jgi:hypothetical protein